MTMNNKCLYCYGELSMQEVDFHEKCSLQFFGTKTAPLLQHTLEEMAELAREIIERHISIPGVQAKLSMTVVKDAFQNSQQRLTIVGSLGGRYILKPPTSEYPELTQNEHVTMRIAEAFGISVVPSSLIRLASGELSFITQRIDRTKKGAKVHMIDMFQILEAFDKYKGSMERIGKALQAYSANPQLDKLFLFERTLFCFLTGNNDMHLKNFSMIVSPAGWVLAPAYDLLNVTIALPEDKEELALTMESKKKKFKWEHFKRFGEGMGLTPKQMDVVLQRFRQYRKVAFEWVDRSFLSEEYQLLYKEVMEERFSRIYGND